jgi:glycosyltransferase involved in cell wall biosynthesis
MDILLVTTANQGGMIHYTSQLANSMHRINDSANVTQVVDFGVDKSLFSSNVEIQELNFPTSFSDNLSTLARSLLYLRKLMINHDIIHLTSRSRIYPLLLPSLYNSKTVYTMHDVVPHSGAFSWSGEITDLVLNKVVDTTLVHGDKALTKFKDKYRGNYNGVSIPHGDYSFFGDFCEPINISYDKELLFFGRIEEYKGLDILLDSMNLLSESYSGDYELVIAGSGDLTPNQLEYIESTDNITLINEYIPNESVCELFTRCRTVILPYRDATQTGVIPIAYSFKKPVICSNVGGLPEVVNHGKTGYLVPPEEPAELAYYCKKLLKSQTLAKKLGKTGDRFRKDRMSWDAISSMVYNVYTRLL